MALAAAESPPTELVGNLKVGAAAVAEDAGAAWLVCAPKRVEGGFPAGVVDCASGDGRVGCGVVAVFPTLNPPNVLEDVDGAVVPDAAAPNSGFWA